MRFARGMVCVCGREMCVREKLEGKVPVGAHCWVDVLAGVYS